VPALGQLTDVDQPGGGGRPSDLPATVDVQSVKVLNVGCLRGRLLTGCGTQTADGWTVETAGGANRPTADVLAQLNLAVP